MPRIDEDRPLMDVARDEYGLAPIAEKLASSIATLASSEGIVFGIEGAWGTGKTTFINFLCGALERAGAVHVVTLSPWLMGDSRSLVTSLAEAIGPLLDREETSTGRRLWNRGKKVAKSIDLMRGYAARTGRGLAPLAKLAGLFVPGAAAAGDLLETGASALDSPIRGKTDEAIKAEITQRILESGAKFVVVIDDLDRLEPAQAAEVMRLIRSVADFPRIAYVLSYDRQVLAHALEIGLNLTDGDLYMQKIVQLTFSLPQPEPFDLRNSLRSKCLELYRAIHDRAPSPDEHDDLVRAIDREGGDLRTPRDVKLVLNNLAFTYPTIATDVHFPDLCRVQLLKALRPRLHSWIERYLGIRAALVSGDANVHKPDRTRLGEELAALLPDDDPASTGSIWSLRNYVPGVIRSDNPEGRVFQSTSNQEIIDLIEGKRLGSPIHHRFYFALSAPKAMIPIARMEEIRLAAGQSAVDLRNILIGYVEQDRPLGQGWYEHLIARLDDAVIEKYAADELAGLLFGFASTFEIAERKFDTRRAFMLSLSDKVQFLVDAIIKRLRKIAPVRAGEAVARVYQGGDLTWLVAHFHRHHLAEQGVIGDRGKPADQWVLTTDERTSGSETLEARIREAQNALLGIHDLGAFIWGWRDLSGIDPVTVWVDEYATEDRNFLKILKSLRNWAVSDRVYYPLPRSTVETFFDYDTVTQRLDSILETGSGDAKADAQAIKTSLDQGQDLH